MRNVYMLPAATMGPYLRRDSGRGRGPVLIEYVERDGRVCILRFRLLTLGIRARRGPGRLAVLAVAVPCILANRRRLSSAFSQPRMYLGHPNCPCAPDGAHAF